MPVDFLTSPRTRSNVTDATWENPHLSNPRAKLLQGDTWERVRSTVCQSLGRSLSPQTELDDPAKRLDEAYQRTAANLPNASVRIEREKGPSGQEQDKLVLTGLEKIEEPDSLLLLRHQVTRRLPPINLPEDVARLSPIAHEHVNVYGKYSFQLSESIQQGAFHPLRDLDETESLEGDQEVKQPAETAQINFGA